MSTRGRGFGDPAKGGGGGDSEASEDILLRRRRRKDVGRNKVFEKIDCIWEGWPSGLRRRS